MNRASREKKASLVKQAIAAMQRELKTASEARKAELFQDLSVAQGDFDALSDFDTYPDEFFDSTMFDADLSLEEPGDLLPASPLDEMETLGDGLPFEAPSDIPEFDSVIESMDGCSGCGGGIEATHDMQGEDMWTATNREHVSYLLDKAADLTAHVEQYEHRAALASKTAKSKGARTAIAAVMKKLASVVHNADFSTEETGKHLDAVGVEVMGLHKQFGLTV